MYLTKYFQSGTLAMKVLIDRQVLEAMLNLAREIHPREVVLLLRGKINRGDIKIEEYLLPPFASSGRGFARFPPHMLPIDFSIVGTAHSHPSISSTPSAADLNHFYSRVMMIFPYPYTEERAAAYNAKGERLPLSIIG